MDKETADIIEQALDALAVALTEHWRQWTTEE